MAKCPRVAEVRGKEEKWKTMERGQFFSEMESVLSFSLHQWLCNVLLLWTMGLSRLEMQAVTYWGWGPTGHSQWENYPSHCHDLTRNTLRKKGFVWTYSLRRDIAYQARKWSAQWVKELSNQQSRIRGRWTLVLGSSSFFQPRAGPVDDTAHMQDESFLLVCIFFWTQPHRHTQSHVSVVTLNPVKWIVKINSHRHAQWQKLNDKKL